MVHVSLPRNANSAAPNGGGKSGKHGSTASLSLRGQSSSSGKKLNTAHFSSNLSEYKTIRIKITNIDEIQNGNVSLNEEDEEKYKDEEGDGNDADNEDDDELVMVDYDGGSPPATKSNSNCKSPSTKSDDKPGRLSAVHIRKYRYIEPSVPERLDNDKLGWIFHRLRETPIGPLDRDGNNQIDLDEFVKYFTNTVNVEDDSIDHSV